MKVLKCVIHEYHEVCNPRDDENYPHYSEYEVMTHKLKTFSILKVYMITFFWDDLPHFTLGGFDNPVFMVDEHL